jgi:hypothetical protein
MRESSAAAWAADQVERVRDDPAGRMALLSGTYERLCRARYVAYRRAALSFMRWQADRGVLRPPGAGPGGSPWWRAINDRLLLDGCEALARATGRGGPPSSASVEPWMAFIAAPSARRWYRAHNGTIVAAYLDARQLAEAESRAERFFLNVALLRVLYVHALVAAPRLALGHLGIVGRVVGDPRLGAVGAYLSLGRVLPDRYPLDGELEAYLADEHDIGRLIDYGVIAPRAQALYQWSAAELGYPEVGDLAQSGAPRYAWSPEDGDYWTLSHEPLAVRVMRRVTRPR